MVFHGIGRAMAVARATEDAAAAAFREPLGVKPPPDSLEAKRFVSFVTHEENRFNEKFLNVNYL
jgi:hypothetical protein